MKRVVIIGGGFAGATVARELEDDFETVLVDNKNYFEFTPSVLRVLVEPKRAKKIQVLHQHYLHSTKIVMGEVKAVKEKYVLLDKGKIEFDYLVIASGSRYELPIKGGDLIKATRAENLRSFNKKILDAKRILLVGGGIVGVELAAEIATHLKNKEIILLHSRERLMDRFPEKVSKIADRFLRKKGVMILTKERFVKKIGKNYVTESGRKISADLAFLCTGIKPNSDFLEKNILMIDVMF